MRSWLNYGGLVVLACSGCSSGNSADAIMAGPSEIASSAAASAAPGIAAAPAPAPAPPDLAGCPDLGPPGDETRSRTVGLAVPAAMAGMLASDLDRYAVRALGGETVCIDTREMGDARDHKLSADGRFLSFHWDGYEGGGHYVVDRSGKGVAFDTGAPPVSSPSKRLIAALEWSESGFGSLNGFAVWQVSPGPMKPVARIEELPEGMTDWRFDGWRGDACAQISAVLQENASFDEQVTTMPPRERFFAEAGTGTWRIRPAAGRGCAGV